MKQAIGRRFQVKACAKNFLVGLIVVLATALPMAVSAGSPQNASAAIAVEGGVEVMAAQHAAETEEYAGGEAARYNLSSVQGARDIQTIAGRAATTEIAFYNSDGNRTAMVNFEIAGPQGWLIEVTWPGRPDTAAGLAVPPGPPAVEPAAELAEGGRSIYLPGRGYVLARVVRLTIRAPNEATGHAEQIAVTALATYPGQDGAAVAQARKFQFSVQVLPAPGS